MAYFPMYVKIEDERVLVAGGGAVALDKVSVLLDFGACPVVVAPELLPEFWELDGVRCEQRKFEEGDFMGCALAVAATDDPAKNHEIAELAKRRGIPVNAVDQPMDCTFLFPSYVKKGNLVGAFSSGGDSPAVTQYLRRELEAVLTERLGEQSAYLGSIRERVKSRVPDREERRQVYERILEELLETGEAELDEEQLSVLIDCELERGLT